MYYISSAIYMLQTKARVDQTDLLSAQNKTKLELHFVRTNLGSAERNLVKFRNIWAGSGKLW